MLDLGVEIARPGARVLAYVEREAFAASVLLARMEDESLEPAPIWCGDLAKCDWSIFSDRVSCVVAGFPCQPFSVAGKRKGTADERWIWDDIIHAVCAIRPGFVFLENVPGLLTTGLGHVLGDLAEVGYDAEWGSLRASAVGASHRRERVFILAHAQRYAGGASLAGREEEGRVATRGSGCSVAHAQGECEREQDDSKCSEPRQDSRQDTSRGSRGLADAKGRELKQNNETNTVGQVGNARQDASGGSGELADAGSKGFEGSELTGALRDRKGSGAYGSATEFRGPLFAPGPNSSQWPVILEFDPSLEPAICRDADGMADRMDRLRACGNGVVPLQAAVAFVELSRRMRP